MMPRLKLANNWKWEWNGTRKFLEISAQELIKLEVNFKLAYEQMERDTKLHHK